MNKFELASQVIRNDTFLSANAGAKILDIGCRDCGLRAFLSDDCVYEGVDLYQNLQFTVRHVMDVSKGLPFGDGSYEYVVALDVVEHLDDFGGALVDFLRVSSRAVIVMLPNMAYSLFRLRFLISGRLGRKYDLTYGQGQDRHRWLTTLIQSDAYMHRFAQDHGINLVVYRHNDSIKKDLFAKAGKLLGLSPQLYIYSSLYFLRKF